MSSETGGDSDEDMFLKSNFQHVFDVETPAANVMDLMGKLVELSCLEDNENVPTKRRSPLATDGFQNVSTATSVSVSINDQIADLLHSSNRSMQLQRDVPFNRPESESSNNVTTFKSGSEISKIYQENQDSYVFPFIPTSSISSEFHSSSNDICNINVTVTTFADWSTSFATPNLSYTDALFNHYPISPCQSKEVVETAFSTPLQSAVRSMPNVISHQHTPPNPNTREAKFVHIRPSSGNKSDYGNLDDLNPNTSFDCLPSGVERRVTNSSAQGDMSKLDLLASAVSASMSLEKCFPQSPNVEEHNQVALSGPSSKYCSSDLYGIQPQGFQPDVDAVLCSPATLTSDPIEAGFQNPPRQNQISTYSPSFNSYPNFQNSHQNAHGNATQSTFETLDCVPFQQPLDKHSNCSESEMTCSSNSSLYLGDELNKTLIDDITNDRFLSTGDIPDCFLRQISEGSTSFPGHSICCRSISEPNSSTHNKSPPIDLDFPLTFQESGQCSSTTNWEWSPKTSCLSPVSSPTETMKRLLAQKLKCDHPLHTTVTKTSKTKITREKIQGVESSSSSSTQKPSNSKKRQFPTSIPDSDESHDEMDFVDKFIKRESNRIAARKCRYKRVKRMDTLTRQISLLESKQGRIKSEIQELQKEMLGLESMLTLHKPFCQRKDL